MHFCTYFDRHYLTRGLALYESLVRHSQRPFTLWVLCFDDETHRILSALSLGQMRLISLAAFEEGDEELVRVKPGRTRVEYYWTCSPSLPLYILDHHPEVDVITYLDADMYFFGDPLPILEEFSGHSVMIVEHRYTPEYEGRSADAGTYNVSVLTFRRDVNGLACLRWWRERCIEWCYARFEDGKFGDLLYLDEWPTRFDGVGVLAHVGVGLAPWNFGRYRVDCHAEAVQVDGAPLICFHFHGCRWVAPQVAQPMDHHYGRQFSARHISRLYQPYLRALRDCRERIETIPGCTVAREQVAKAGGLVSGLFRQQFLLAWPQGVGMVLWGVAARLETRRAEVMRCRRRGIQQFREGAYGAARRSILSAIRLHPHLALDRTMVGILLRSYVMSRRNV